MYVEEHCFFEVGQEFKIRSEPVVRRFRSYLKLLSHLKETVVVQFAKKTYSKCYSTYDKWLQLSFRCIRLLTPYIDHNWCSTYIVNLNQFLSICSNL